MPYIEDAERDTLEGAIIELAMLLKDGDFRGRLNYTISSLFAHLIQANGLSYRLLNDFIGVLECSKLEAYRRIGGPYEDIKIADNGDVY